MTKIGEQSENLEITFNSKRFKQTLNSHKEVLDKYYNGFEIAAKLEGESPIFLDTNVLLRIYSTSFKAREKFKTFLTDYKERIVLTSQVQWEYIKNRESVINKFSKDVTQELPSLFNSNILNPINSFIDINKNVTKDFDAIEKGLLDLSRFVKKLSETINSEISKSDVSSNKIIYKDEFIELLQNVKLLDPLPPELIRSLKSEYDENLKSFEKSDIEKQTFKTFPGCAEKKDKMDDPYGDYIIFHEIINYSKTNNCDAIFLTYDTSKGDWIQINKNPHLHYVDNFYLNTNNLIYILDAERTLNDLLDINFKSLIPETTIDEDLPINVTNLKLFLESCPLLQVFDREDNIDSIKDLANELLLNNFRFMSEIENIILKAKAFLHLLNRKQYGKYNTVGGVRSTMKVVVDNYLANDANGKISPHVRNEEQKGMLKIYNS